MNRKIKFRGFSENLNKWLYGSLVTGLFHNTKTKKDCPIIIDYESNVEYCCLGDFDECDNDVVLESVGQYTGLKDKNGKEIYEGDIVSYYNKYSNKTYTHIVKWDELWAVFGLFEKDNQWCKESDWLKITDIEILGNIYENHELMK